MEEVDKRFNVLLLISIAILVLVALPLMVPVKEIVDITPVTETELDEYWDNCKSALLEKNEPDGIYSYSAEYIAMCELKSMIEEKEE